MSDLIERQAAIAAADRADYTGFIVEDVKTVTDEVVKELKQLPSVQPEKVYVAEVKVDGEELQRCVDRAVERLKEEGQTDRWIPCSERLPEVGRCVLLSVGGMYVAEGCLREDGDWTQFRWSAIQRKDMVGAWMPLPDPYKEEQE